MKNKLLPALRLEQLGFKKDSGTRNAVFFLRTVGEKCIGMRYGIYLTFIAYEKGLDKVKHNLLMNDLKQIGIDRKDLPPGGQPV